MRAIRPGWGFLLLLLVGFALYAGIASRHVEPFTTAVYKGPLGADTLNGAEAYAKLKYEWKHPLMSPFTAGATALFRLLPGFDRALAITGGIALLATANLALCALVLWRLLGDRIAAALGTALYACLFTNLNVLAITDSYTVSSLAIWLFLLAWLDRAAEEGRAEPEPTRPWLRPGLLAGVAGLCNLPLLSLAGLPALRTLLTGRPRRAVLLGLASFGLALALVLTVVLIHSTRKWGTPWAYFARSAGYTDQYAELERFTQLAQLVDVLGCFLLFAVASPVAAIPGSGLRHTDVAAYLADPGGLLALAAVILVTGGAVAALTGRHWRTALALWAWIAALAAFYTLFNPVDAMLYSTQVQGVLALLACLGFASHARSPRTLYLLLAAAVLLLAARNLPIVLAGPYGFKFWYAPVVVPSS